MNKWLLVGLAFGGGVLVGWKLIPKK